MFRNFTCFLFCLIGAFALSAYDTCIQVKNGVPQLCVDGEAVVPRWCYARTQQGEPWVADHSVVPESSLTLLPEPTRWTRDFVALEDGEVELSAQIVLHEYFQSKPLLEMWVDDFSLMDLTENRAIIPETHFDSAEENPFKWYPKDLATYRVEWSATGGVENSPALKITWKDIVSRAPEHGEHVYTSSRNTKLTAGHEYRVSFWSNATSSARMDVRLVGLSEGRRVMREKYDVMQATVKLAKDAGVDFVSTMADFPWPREGEEEDWTVIDTTLANIIAVNPQAKIVPRLVCTPPQWWLEAHPEECLGWQENPQDAHPLRECFSSLVWRQESKAHLRRIIGHIEEHFGANIIGYHICPGACQEFFYGDYSGPDCPGFSPCEIAAWRRWLTTKYHTDNALRAAWRDDTVTLADVAPISPERRRQAATAGILLDPREFQDVIDQNLFFSDMTVEVIDEFAALIREMFDRRRLTLFFYGYGFEISNWPSEGKSGHYALQKVLDNPDVDILCSPLSYFDRLEGGFGGMMAPVESILRSGKLWFVEDDMRTYLTASGDLGGLPDYVRTREGSRQVLLRDNGEELVRNLGCWWMDLGSCRWFEDPALWEIMELLRPAEQRKLASPEAYRPPVAMILDEKEYSYSQNAVEVRAPLLSVGRQALSRLGAGTGQYLLSEVLKNGLPDARLVILPDAWALTAEERTALKALLADKFVLWCYAPGMCDCQMGVSTENTLALTGFQITQKNGNFQEVHATKQGRMIGLPECWRMDGPIRQVTAVIPQEGDIVLATWQDGDAAIVLRENALYNATSTLDWHLLRLAAQKAGVHLYTDKPGVFYTDGRFLVFHAVEDGPVTLKFPRKCGELWDIARQTMIGKDTDTIILDFIQGETRVLERIPARVRKIGTQERNAL